MRRFFLVFGFFVALSAGALAQPAPAKRPMTFDDMMAMKRLGETAVSPDGNVFVQASPGIFDTPSHFWEWSINKKGKAKLTASWRSGWARWKSTMS